MPKIFNITLNNTFKKNNERSVFLLHVYFTHPDFFCKQEREKEGERKVKAERSREKGQS